MDNDNMQKSVQGLIELMAKENYNPSISMTIYDNGKYHSFNTGYADLEKKTPATENTIYAIGSSTKAFAAEALCILADRGLVDLDKPVREYMPDFAMHDAYASNALSVRDILCHRCGLPRHDATWSADSNIANRDKLIHNIRHLKPFATFRSRWHYQNHMYVLAGCLIEKVSGLAWDDFVKKEIMEPIGLEACFKIDDFAMRPDASLPYSVTLADGTVQPTKYRNIYHVGAAGCINSTTKQMAKWVALQLNDGMADGKQIISSDMLKECHSPQMIIQRVPESSQFPEITHRSYGLGWFTEVYRGRTIVHHGGNIDGYSAMHFFVPDFGFGASILTNSEGTPIQNSLMYSLLDLYFGDAPIDWSARLKDVYIDMLKKGKDALDSLKEKSVKGTKPSLPLADYAARYVNLGYGDINVKHEDGALVAEFGVLCFKMEHLCLDSFIMKLQPLEKHTVTARFNMGLSGEIESFCAKFEPMLKEMIVFERCK